MLKIANDEHLISTYCGSLIGDNDRDLISRYLEDESGEDDSDGVHLFTNLFLFLNLRN